MRDFFHPFVGLFTILFFYAILYLIGNYITRPLLTSVSPETPVEPIDKYFSFPLLSVIFLAFGWVASVILGAIGRDVLEWQRNRH